MPNLNLNNMQYRNMQVEPETYIPDIGKEYPQDDPLTRLVPSVKQIELKFDSTYPYLDDSFAYKFRHALNYIFFAWGIVYLANKVKFGMKYEGRSILRKYRKEFKKGIVTVSNHCYPWDGAAISQALCHTLWIPMLSEHFQGKDRWFLRYFGGIPLSDGSFNAVKKFNEAFDTIHARGGWVHVFPEARNWLFYKPIRPFQKGAFTMAYKWDAPVLPLCVTYRQRKGIYKLFAKAEIPLLTVKIGEPIFPDVTKPRKEEVDHLHKAAFEAICSLAGIKSNPWPYAWNESGR